MKSYAKREYLDFILSGLAIIILLPYINESEEPLLRVRHYYPLLAFAMAALFFLSVFFSYLPALALNVISFHVLYGKILYRTIYELKGFEDTSHLFLILFIPSLICFLLADYCKLSRFYHKYLQYKEARRVDLS